MKKKFTLLTVGILCVVSIGAVIAYNVVPEIKAELKPPEYTTITDADVIADTSKQSQNKVKDNKKEIDQNSFISKDEAIEIALNKINLSVSDVTLKKAKLDEDDGLWIYEVEFYHNRTKYEAEILATYGTIISWDVDKN